MATIFHIAFIKFSILYLSKHLVMKGNWNFYKLFCFVCVCVCSYFYDYVVSVPDTICRISFFINVYNSIFICLKWSQLEQDEGLLWFVHEFSLEVRVLFCFCFCCFLLCFGLRTLACLFNKEIRLYFTFLFLQCLYYVLESGQYWLSGGKICLEPFLLYFTFLLE